MAYCEHTSKARASAIVNAPEIIIETVLADNTRNSAMRLEHLFEAQRVALALLADVQTAIREEQAMSGAIAATLIAQRVKAAAGVKS